jgi:tRNA threonylcarbamoyladenosine modification (KEOPS) complex  Pcc1 subunit
MPTAFIDIKDPLKKKVIYTSLLPETKIPRAIINLSASPQKLRIKISTDDSVSLRAACNSLLRWVDVAAQMYSLVNQCK